MNKFTGTEASEIAEAALVLPLLFAFIFGIIWMGRAFNIYATISRAAQAGAIVAARPHCATCGNDFPSDATVQAAITETLAASSIDPSQILPPSPPLTPVACLEPYPPPLCSTANQITICRAVLLSGLGQIPQCGVIVSFRYPFHFYRQVIMKAQAQSRMEN